MFYLCNVLRLILVPCWNTEFVNRCHSHISGLHQRGCLPIKLLHPIGFLLSPKYTNCASNEISALIIHAGFWPKGTRQRKAYPQSEILHYLPFRIMSHVTASVVVVVVFVVVVLFVLFWRWATWFPRLRFSTSVEVRLGIVGSLVGWSVHLLFFRKTAHRIILIFCMNVPYYKGKKRTRRFSREKSGSFKNSRC